MCALRTACLARMRGSSPRRSCSPRAASAYHRPRYLVRATLVHPAAGSVMLASDDPTAKPRILNNVFSDQADLDTAVAALRVALDIARQPAMAPYTEALYTPPASESESTCETTPARARNRCTIQPAHAPWER